MLESATCGCEYCSWNPSTIDHKSALSVTFDGQVDFVEALGNVLVAYS